MSITFPAPAITLHTITIIGDHIPVGSGVVVLGQADDQDMKWFGAWDIAAYHGEYTGGNPDTPIYDIMFPDGIIRHTLTVERDDPTIRFCSV